MRAICLMALGGFACVLSVLPAAQAQDRIMGQVNFLTNSKSDRTSGVWIDGQYVGYLGELKGSGRLRLLPGDHVVTVRQAGYSDFTKRVVIEPRMIVDVRVSLERDSRFTYPDPKTSSEVRLNVQPGRAAVFLDDYYVGTVDEFYGIEHAMLVVPGKHRFKIALPGFRTFETEVTLLPRQKFALRTDLMTGSINDADPAIRSDAPAARTTGRDPGPRASR